MTAHTLLDSRDTGPGTGEARCSCGKVCSSYGERAARERQAQHALGRDAQVGDFATYSIGSDRWAVEIIARTATKVTTRTAATVIAGAGSIRDDQPRPDSYVLLPDERGSINVFTERRDGTWRARGGDYGFLHFGHAETRLDAGF